MVVPRRIARITALAAALALTPAIAHSQILDILSLRISSELVPAGAIAQVKVEVTESTPITTGDSHIIWSLGAIDGISLGGDDSAGVAVVRDGVVALSILSPTAAIAMSSDYPLVTLTGHVPVDAPLGTRLPVILDASALRMFDPTGAMYTASEIDDGKVVVANRVSISDVVPGSADLPAGSVVSIFGTGFNRHTRIAFGTALLSRVQYVSPTRIDVVLAEPAHMHGMRIRARSEDGFRMTYFSYQRTTRTAASEDPLLRDAVPVFPLRGLQAATIRADETTVGLALQNIGTTDADVLVELENAAGGRVASAVVPVGVNQYVLRTVSEMLGVPSGAGSIVRVTSATPVQVLAVDVDSTGVARPRLPEQ